METFIGSLNFKGRANRTEFWVVIFTILAITLVPASLYYKPNSDELDQYVLFITILTMWPYLAVQVRRWHDRNKSGWWVLITLIPIIGYIWSLIELGFLPSVPSMDSDHISPSLSQAK